MTHAPYLVSAAAAILLAAMHASRDAVAYRAPSAPDWQQEQWSVIAQGTRGKIEIDLSRLHRSADGVRDVWIRMSFDDDQTLPTGATYATTLGHKFVDCVRGKFGSGANYWLDRQQNAVLSTDGSKMTMVDVVPDSPSALVTKYVCDLPDSAFVVRPGASSVSQPGHSAA